jgi:hypothetical protein
VRGVFKAIYLTTSLPPIISPGKISRYTPGGIGEELGKRD